VGNVIGNESTMYSTLNQITATDNSDGYQLVIGTNSAAEDNIAAIDIAGYYGITQTIEDTQASTNNNLIVVGGPCANSIANELMGNLPDCTQGFEPGKGTVNIFYKNGKKQILIAGQDALQTRIAAQVVVKKAEFQDLLNVNGVITFGTSLTDINIEEYVYTAMSAPAEPDCPGDVTGDDFVGASDLNIILSNWGKSPATRSEGDLSGDKLVAGQDYGEVLSYWGKSCGSCTSSGTCGIINATAFNNTWTQIATNLDIDGVYAGMTPIVVQNVNSGTRLLNFTKPGYYHNSTYVNVVAGEETIVYVKLQKWGT